MKLNVRWRCTRSTNFLIFYTIIIWAHRASVIGIRRPCCCHRHSLQSVFIVRLLFAFSFYFFSEYLCFFVFRVFRFNIYFPRACFPNRLERCCEYGRYNDSAVRLCTQMCAFLQSICVYIFRLKIHQEMRTYVDLYTNIISICMWSY